MAVGLLVKKLAVTKGVHVYGLETTVRRPYKDHAFVEQVEVPDDACLLSVLEEEPTSDGAYFGGSLVTLFSAETETPASWYPTGNAFKVRERFAILLRANPRVLKNVQMRASATLAKLSTFLGVGPSLTGGHGLWGLPKEAVPHQRWVASPWQRAKEVILETFRPNEEVHLGDAVKLARKEPRRFIYLNVAESLPGWLKVGKADRCFVERLWKQQLCNPRVLGHLRVWEVPDDAQLHAEETYAKSVLKNAGATKGPGGSEWRKIDWKTATQALEAEVGLRCWQAVQRPN
jgi:hypothetical protein